MDWEAFGSIAELVGAIAVIASLLYVGRQVRESSRATKGQTYDSISNRLNEAGAQTVNDPDLMDICLRATSGEPVSATELPRYTGFVHNLFRILESAYHQHELGLIEEDKLKPLFHSTSVYIASEHGQKMWETRRHLHDAKFQKFVDSLIQSTDVEAITKGFGIDH